MLTTACWGERELADCDCKSLCRADKVRKQLRINFHATFVFRQVSFVVGLEERLHVGVVGAQRVRKGLEDNIAPVVGAISLLTQRGERQPMGGALGQRELTIDLYALVLGVGQADPSRCDHVLEFLPCGRLGFEAPNPYEVVELLLAHG